ncbi:cyclopropane fatty acyl phospholipid synthase [Piscinibacter sakaiensis]|uniref:Cyclopropane-fatty-acyl-phospholipid synthase n=1 Tax=Piscinibacter sakaiensis TaxID=1547922 RepID=A0A0K8NXD0_PISS1|nr:cyclopropane fatty acyl phospholipid synthase [Piscinibacter sakaiensis]GAP35057.1 cyclopropane-fatty-acyl-phospholipid synthase [Piscinibacter sakaiensis]
MAVHRSEFTVPAASKPPVSAARGARRWLEDLLAQADVRIDGDRPWDLRLHAPGVPERVLAQGSLGLGEAYMDGDWSAERLDQLFERIVRARLADQVQPLSIVWHHLKARWTNRQTARRAWEVGRRHYDLDDDVYQAMLDPRMTYTCGYWAQAQDLAQAQEHKLEMVCRKLRLRPGMRLLDIGCGWGSLMRYAAERHGVRCVGVTVSERQVALGRAMCRGLPVEFRLQDYRDIDGRYDAIASLGMFEHVGRRNDAAFMRVARRCLADDGLFLLHTIGRNEDGHGTDAWIDRYVFPNGELPTLARLGRAFERRFVVEDLHNFGADYDRTLMAWHANIEAAWPRFAQRLGERFRRQWRYYLLSCAGAFRARDIQLWQFVLSKDGLRGGYERPAAPSATLA